MLFFGAGNAFAAPVNFAQGCANLQIVDASSEVGTGELGSAAAGIIGYEREQDPRRIEETSG